MDLIGFLQKMLDKRIQDWYNTLDYIEKNNIDFSYDKKHKCSLPNFNSAKLTVRYLKNYDNFIKYILEWSKGHEIKFKDGKLF
jgi:hypothetical protein